MPTGGLGENLLGEMQYQQICWDSQMKILLKFGICHPQNLLGPSFPQISVHTGKQDLKNPKNFPVSRTLIPSNEKKCNGPKPSRISEFCDLEIS